MFLWNHGRCCGHCHDGNSAGFRWPDSNLQGFFLAWHYLGPGSTSLDLNDCVYSSFSLCLITDLTSSHFNPWSPPCSVGWLTWLIRVLLEMDNLSWGLYTFTSTQPRFREVYLDYPWFPPRCGTKPWAYQPVKRARPGTCSSRGASKLAEKGSGILPGKIVKAWLKMRVFRRPIGL